MTGIEIVAFTKSDGPLTKKISLDASGNLMSDGSASVMERGQAHRAWFPNLQAFADALVKLRSDQAIALGALRRDLPVKVRVTTKARLDGHNTVNLIARTADAIMYRPGQPGLALLDFDCKGMSPAVADKISSAGDVWRALVSVIPDLLSVAHVIRSSTSTGLFRTDTGERFQGSGGQHIYVQVKDGGDVDRFLRTLHDRCWLAGFGWCIVGRSGQLLERSVIDRMVGASERLVFEGAPVLEPPLDQDRESRRPIVVDGDALDTLAACPPLTIVEKARLDTLKTQEAYRLTGEQARVRAKYIDERTKEIVERRKISPEAGRRIVEQHQHGILLPDTILEFDDQDLAGTAVSDVLADPEKYEGCTLADPAEGIAYGRCKAMVLRRPDGSVWIRSFAHGLGRYDLKHDVRSVEAAITAAPHTDAADVWVRMVLAAHLDDGEIAQLLELAHKKTGIGKRPLSHKLNAARQQQKQNRIKEEQQRQAAERLDPRPQFPVPAADAEWLPVMDILNEVIGQSKALEPLMRDVEGIASSVFSRHTGGLVHLLTSAGADKAESAESRLPAPEQPLLCRLSETELAEAIERELEFTDQGRPVHLPTAFVKHFWQRKGDNALPLVTAVTTMPVVLPDGTVLAGRGLDRERHIVFRIPEQVLRLLPKPEACTGFAVAEAVRFLCEEWLGDVATDYVGKCVLIALALTLIQRLLLTERPAFFTTAGQRGSGKTTALHMIAVAVLGHKASAAAWSTSEEERRKSLFALLGGGFALVVWDNIARGTSISCPSIEKALTAETYTDRILGETRQQTVPAFTILTFTGNNIQPRGDLGSRSLIARLSADRPDPENREFRHPDPIGWTQAHRGQILRALYVVLLGNPALRHGSESVPQTRFKDWYHLIGSAIEHAAAEYAWCNGSHDLDEAAKTIRFKDIFLSGEEDDEQSESLASVIEMVRREWPLSFSAQQAATWAGSATESGIQFKAALETAAGKAIIIPTSRVLARRLKAIKDIPIQMGDKALALRYFPDKTKNGGTFRVEEVGW